MDKYYHCIFRTYKSRQILTDEKVISFLRTCFTDICKSKGFTLIACSILSDHIHCLIGFSCKHRIDYVMRMIKGVSSRKFFLEFNHIDRLYFRKLWSRSYYAKGRPENKISEVAKYVNSKKDINGDDKRFKEPTCLPARQGVSLSGSFGGNWS